MRMLAFAKRNFKEIARDPLSVIFALLLPLFLLFVFQQIKVPGEAYRIENFTPGIVIFSFSFVTMFTATLVAKDRATSLLVRLGVSPMRGGDYVLGYMLAMLPLVLVQNLLFFSAALLLDLPFSWGVMLAALASLPVSLLFIGLGILLGAVTGEKSAPGVASVVVQLVAFTGGMYFDGEMVGDFFATLCRILPFSAATDLLKILLNSTGEHVARAVITVGIWTVAVLILAVCLFRRNMLRGKK